MRQVDQVEELVPATPPPLGANPRLRLQLDLAEKIVFSALYLWLCMRFAGSIDEKPLNLLFLATEGFVLLMVMFRRSTDQISADPKDWSVAFAGTFLTMLVMPGEAVPGLQLPALLLLSVGLVISVSAKLQLRRSFGVVAANRGVKTSGVYAMVRHPMYLGYFLSNWGMLLVNWSWWNLSLLAVWTLMQIGRIRAEERVLTADPVYRQLCQRVRYRLIPLVY